MNISRSPMTCCASPYKIGQEMPYMWLRHLCQHSFPKSSPNILILSYPHKTSHVAQTHYTLLFLHDTMVKKKKCLSFLPVCPSSLTANAISSLKHSQTHPVCPLELFYYTYVICLFKHWLDRTTLKKPWGLKN